MNTFRPEVSSRGFLGNSGQFRTVPSCSICNNGSSEDDEALRNYISAQIGKQTDGAKNLWEKGALKSLKRSNKLRSGLLSTLQEMEIANEDGTSTTRLAFIIPVSLYQRIFERVTRGLYFYHTGRILPPDTPVKINLLNNAPNLTVYGCLLFTAHIGFNHRRGSSAVISNILKADSRSLLNLLGRLIKDTARYTCVRGTRSVCQGAKQPTYQIASGTDCPRWLVPVH